MILVFLGLSFYIHHFFTTIYTCKLTASKWVDDLDFLMFFCLITATLFDYRKAKRKLDNRSFFGGILHVAYGPEFESVEETREKLMDRKRVVERKINCMDNNLFSCKFILNFYEGNLSENVRVKEQCGCTRWNSKALTTFSPDTNSKRSIHYLSPNVESACIVQVVSRPVAACWCQCYFGKLIILVNKHENRVPYLTLFVDARSQSRKEQEGRDELHSVQRDESGTTATCSRVDMTEIEVPDHQSMTSSSSTHTTQVYDDKPSQPVDNNQDESTYIPLPPRLPPLTVPTYPSQVSTLSTSLNAPYHTPETIPPQQQRGPTNLMDQSRSIRSSSHGYNVNVSFPARPPRQETRESSKTSSDWADDVHPEESLVNDIDKSMKILFSFLQLKFSC